MRSTAVGLAGALAVLAGSWDAQGFCRTMTCKDTATQTCPTAEDGCPGGGVPVAWPGRCVSYSVALGASAIPFDILAETTERAFDAWRQIICADTDAHPTILVNNTYGPVYCDRHEYNASQPNANAIIYREGPWPYEDAMSALALTSVTFDKATGTIYDADIEVNGSGGYGISWTDQAQPGCYDLQSILTHEIGHFLGLGHSLSSSATMWWQYSTDDVSYRKLTDDDIAGLCAIYPSNGTSEVCDFTPRQGFSPECRMDMIRAGRCEVSPSSSASGQGTAWAVGLVASALALLRLRRRPRAAPPSA